MKVSTVRDIGKPPSIMYQHIIITKKNRQCIILFGYEKIVLIYYKSFILSYL